VVRVDPGTDPTHTALTEVYEPPFPGYGPRGGDIDRNGVFWASLASGHLASFDRRKCKVLNGATATGKHCPEGWTLYPFPGPQFRDVVQSGSVEASYYTWVDQFDTFGMGKNVPIATGNLNDALLAFVDNKFLVFRVPYPIGYFTKWMDGRVDDPNGGWKGKSLWSTYATRTMFPEFTYTGATYDVDASLARGWVDELVDANALTQRARTAAQEMARLSPRAFTQAKKQLRQQVSERVERGGVTTDQTVTDIWTEALGYIRDYVARTLNKS
jgi:hypothetical protein